MKVNAAIAWLIALTLVLGIEQTFSAPIPHGSLGMQVREDGINVITRDSAVSLFARRDLITGERAATQVETKSTLMKQVAEGLFKFFRMIKEWSTSKAGDLKELGRRFGAWFKRVKTRVASERSNTTADPKLPTPAIPSVNSAGAGPPVSGTSHNLASGALILSPAAKGGISTVPAAVNVRPVVDTDVAVANTPGVSGALDRFVPMMRGGLNNQEDVERARTLAALRGPNFHSEDNSAPGTLPQPAPKVPIAGSRSRPLPGTPELDTPRAPASKADNVLRVAKERAASGKLAKERAAAQKLANERASAEKLAKEQAAAAAEKSAKERIAAEELAKERAVAEKLARERAAAEKSANERAAAEKLANERASAEKLAKEQAAAAEKSTKERAAAEELAKEQAAAVEKSTKERAAAEELAREQAASEKLARERAAAEELMRKLDSEYEGSFEDDDSQDNRSGLGLLLKAENERQNLDSVAGAANNKELPKEQTAVSVPAKQLSKEQIAAEKLMQTLDSEYEGSLEDDRNQDSRSGFERLAKTEYERQALDSRPPIVTNAQDSKEIDQAASKKAVKQQEQAAREQAVKEETARNQLQVARVQPASNEPAKDQPARAVRFPAFEREVDKMELRVKIDKEKAQKEREEERTRIAKEFRQRFPSAHRDFALALKDPNSFNKNIKDRVAAEDLVKTLDSEYEGAFEDDQNQDNRSGLEQLVQAENDKLKELGPDHRSPMNSESGPPRGTNGAFAETQKQLKELETTGYDYLEVPQLKSLERANPNQIDPLDAVFIDQGIDPMKINLRERRLYAIIFEWYRQNKAPHDIHHPQHNELYDANRNPPPDADGKRNLWGTELYHEQMTRPAPIPYLREQMKQASTLEKLGNLFKFGVYSNDPNRPSFWYHKWIPGLDRSRELEDWIDDNIPASWVYKNFPTKAGPSTSQRYNSEIDPAKKKELLDKYNENYKEAADLHNWIEADNVHWLGQASAVDRIFHKGGDVIEAMESVPSIETLRENPKAWKKVLRKALGDQNQYNELHRTQYKQDAALDQLHERLRDNDVVVVESKPMEKFPW